MNNFKNFFLEKVKKNKYSPKFKTGDIIYNSKYKIFRKVIDIVSIGTNNGILNTYVFKDLVNPLRNKLDMEIFKVYKPTQKIDAFYSKVENRTFILLFGDKYE